MQVRVGKTDCWAQIMAQLAISLLSNIICRLAAARAICLRAQAAVFEELEENELRSNRPQEQSGNCDEAVAAAQTHC